MYSGQGQGQGQAHHRVSAGVGIGLELSSGLDTGEFLDGRPYGVCCYLRLNWPICTPTLTGLNPIRISHRAPNPNPNLSLTRIPGHMTSALRMAT